jgi:hypothetical protein
MAETGCPKALWLTDEVMIYLLVAGGDRMAASAWTFECVRALLDVKCYDPVLHLLLPFEMAPFPDAHGPRTLPAASCRKRAVTDVLFPTQVRGC